MERPIEEVIGWEQRENEERRKSWHRPGCQEIRTVGSYYHPSCGKPTVDDLAAWLRARGGSAAREVEAAVTSYLYYEVPTILAALTAAVRKVAGDA